MLLICSLRDMSIFFSDKYPTYYAWIFAQYTIINYVLQKLEINKQ